MDDERKAKEYEKSLKDDLKLISKLKKINDNAELGEFIELLIKTAAQKMVWAFTADNIKNWDDYCRVRGEIVSYLYPVQEVRGASAMEKALKAQLDTYYKNTVD